MRVISLGEAMLELRNGANGWALGFGGDTLNTALHLARFGHDVAYATALGQDPFSEELTQAWAAEGIDTATVLTDAERRPGLYAIRTDGAGERRFFYWREHSAARRLHAHADRGRIEVALQSADLFYYSLISLAILPPEGREWVFDCCRVVRAHGGRVAFDANYRPALWASSQEARDWRDAALSCADIGLPTLADESELDASSTAASVQANWARAGVVETVVKLGAEGCRLADGSRSSATCVPVPVDTSGAGDAFNAGYLHGRLSGESEVVAAHRGHALAGWVIQRAGAIPARDSGFDYA
jgi:2-dehydro-3-deoxygluconokinase